MITTLDESLDDDDDNVGVDGGDDLGTPISAPTNRDGGDDLGTPISAPTNRALDVTTF